MVAASIDIWLSNVSIALLDSIEAQNKKHQTYLNETT